MSAKVYKNFIIVKSDLQLNLKVVMSHQFVRSVYLQIFFRIAY